MSRPGPAATDRIGLRRLPGTPFGTAVAVALLMFASIGMAAADDIVPVGVTKEELFGTMLRSSKWKTMPIAVCWENPSDGDADKRVIVRHAVEETWVANAAITFTGWDNTCGDKTPGVHIHISDEQPHTRAMGYYLDQLEQGLPGEARFLHLCRRCA
jgi:hypothetical protein